MHKTRIIARHLTIGAAALTLVVFGVSPSPAADILKEWAGVKAPTAPKLKPVTLDGKTTALLVLDLGRVCKQRPRCAESLPKVKTLVDAARSAGAMIFYTFPQGDPQNVADPGISPKEGEWVRQGGPDKFLGSRLEERLKARSIKTVVVTGTSAQGSVLGTGSGAAQRGYKVILPIDAVSSEDAYMEQYAIWHMYQGGPAVVVGATTVTRSDMIKF